MPKNEEITSLDHRQYSARMFGQDNDAQRVVIVGGENFSIKADVQVPERQIDKIEIPVIVKETVFEKIEIPVVIKETVFEKVEIPVVTESVKIIEIEKPIILQNTVIETVQIPIITKEIEKLDFKIKALLVAQAISVIVYVIHSLIK